MTLPEVLIAMVITSVVTSVLLMGTVSIYRGHNFTQQDSESLGALRTSLDRFEKEVRQARFMYNDSTPKLVHVWVDYDRDNQQDPVEQILWKIEEDPDLPPGSNRAQLTRGTGATAEVVVSRNLVFDPDEADFVDNFVYNNELPDPVEEASMITVTFVARAAGSLRERTVTTRVRLRNADFQNDGLS